MYMYVCMSKELIQNIDGTLAMLKKKHWWIVMAWLWSGRSVPQVWPQERLLVFFLSSASWIPAAVHVQAFIHTHILNLLLSLSPSDLFKKDSTSISDLMNTDRKHYNLSDTCSHFISSFVLLLLVSGGLCLLSFERVLFCWKNNVLLVCVRLPWRHRQGWDRWWREGCVMWHDQAAPTSRSLCFPSVLLLLIV